MEFDYQQGFGNHFESEVINGCIPRDQNSPQKVAFGLYAEQLSGSAFTVPRKDQQKRPSVIHEPFKRLESSTLVSDFSVQQDHLDTVSCLATPNQLRWSPKEISNGDFQQGLTCVCGEGSPSSRDGIAIYTFTCSKNMKNKAMYNSDGDFLIVPQLGSLLVTSEMGKLFVKSGEILLMPNHSPFDVVGWQGNYAPCKYDLSKFNTINTVSFDHPDPSIFTVLTAKSPYTGVALLDFVIFPPRWMVAENTFRPPYYHRNCMSEFMGLISGTYDAKKDGFVPGGASLHSIMSSHGPDSVVFSKASTEELKPIKLDPNGLAFMFESYKMLSVTKSALNDSSLQKDYYKCWQSLPKYFNPKDCTAGAK